MMDTYPMDSFKIFEEKMTRSGLSRQVTRAFKSCFQKWERGDTGKIPWSTIRPVRIEELPDRTQFAEDLDLLGQKTLKHLAVIKLNGGLGTTMGCEGAKSCIVVKESKTFLDLICESLIQINQRYGVKIPIYFMNSFNTADESEQALAKYRNQLHWEGFLQNKVPRIDEKTHLPFEYPRNPDLEWNPPGHGDLYAALFQSGLAEQLLEQKIEYLFVSNADNLGAIVDTKILGYIRKNGLTFLMETTPKTLSDRKGGSIFFSPDGKLNLLEIAQVESAHLDAFQEPKIFPVFNTNNIWIHLPSLAKHFSEHTLDLTLIVNRKTVEDHAIVQLETAMGSAINSFKNSGAILVPRTRFFPVKTTADLLLLQSDYVVLDDGYLNYHPHRKSLLPPSIILGDAFRSAADFESRVPFPLQMHDAESLLVEGDIFFGKDIAIKGRVSIRCKPGRTLQIPDNSILEGEIIA